MEEIRSSGLMPESREEFPAHAEGRTWGPFLELVGRAHHPNSLAKIRFLPIVPSCALAL